MLTAFAATSYFSTQAGPCPSVCVPLPMPTADPVLLARAAYDLLPRIDDGVKYVRAGIMVTDLRPKGNQAPLPVLEIRTRNAASARSWRRSAGSTAGVRSAWVTRESGAARTGA